MTFPVFGLLVAAGAAVVAQNLLMAHMTGIVSTVLITLALNSAAGLPAIRRETPQTTEGPPRMT